MATSMISVQSIIQWEVASERMEAKFWTRPIIQNEGQTAYILRYMVIKKGVIKDVAEDMELENFMQQLNSDNHNKHPIPFQITDTDLR
jgi:hypothetical protein